MSTEQNKAGLRRWMEGWSTRSMSVMEPLVDEIFTADFTIHDKGQPAAPVGREGVKQFVRDALKNTPDIHVATEDMIAQGDRVAWRGAVSGTDVSTGKPTRLLIIEFYRFAGGKIAEGWSIDVQAEPQA